MLLKLELNKEKVKAWNTRVNEYIKKTDKDDLMFKNMIIDSSQNRVLFPSDNHPIGFYGVQSKRIIKDLTDYKVKEDYDSFAPKDLDEFRLLIKYGAEDLGRNNYGTCDNYRQILKKYPELITEKDSLFIVSLSMLTKEHNGGFRWHKNGVYIGDRNPQCEHFGDEDFDNVIQFHIYELEEAE